MILFQCMAMAPTDLSFVTATDALLFRQDAVYQLLQQQIWPTMQLYALQQDVEDRGLALKSLPIHLKLISDPEWVALTLTAQQVVLC